MRFTLKRFNAGLLAMFVVGIAALAAGASPAATVAAVASPAGASAGASADDLAPAIEGGQSATLGQTPWSSVALVQAQIPGPDPQVILCSGTVVAPTLILTAGHCAFEVKGAYTLIPASDYTVMTNTVSWTGTNPLAGAFTAGPDGELSPVTQVIPDPSFAWTGQVADHDAALLVLATATTAPAIQLATSVDSGLYAAGSTVETAGWGATSPHGTEIPQTLQWTSQVLQSQATCADPENSGWDAADQICSSGSGSNGTCEGDSGGPLIANAATEPVEIGITSYGSDNSCNSTYQANVLALSGWLGQEISTVTPPTVTTQPATGVTPTAAVLHGSLTVPGTNTTYAFQYGLTTSYNSTTPTLSVNGATAVAASLSGLQAATTYHYRIVVTYGSAVFYGADETFTTLSATGGKTGSGDSSTAAIKKPLAGTYRGGLARHGLITIKVPRGRRTVSRISLRIGLRCTKVRGIATFNVALKAHRLNTHRGFGLSATYVLKRYWRYRLTATFTKTGGVRGAINVTGTHQRTGTCRSGTLHWKAHK